MKKHQIIFLSLMLLTLWNCQPDPFWQSAKCGNCINFENLQVGQESRYQAFEGYQETRKSKYLDQILVVKVVAQNNRTFTFEEYLLDNPDSVRTYTSLANTDTLRIDLPQYHRSSWLFDGGHLPFLILELDRTNHPKTSLKNGLAGITCDFISCQGYLPIHIQQGKRYKDLLVYQNYGPMTSDGLGYFALYNRKNGVLRVGMLSGLYIEGYPSIRGWDLIEK